MREFDRGLIDEATETKQEAQTEASIPDRRHAWYWNLSAVVRHNRTASPSALEVLPSVCLPNLMPNTTDPFSTPITARYHHERRQEGEINRATYTCRSHERAARTCFTLMRALPLWSVCSQGKFAVNVERRRWDLQEYERKALEEARQKATNGQSHTATAHRYTSPTATALTRPRRRALISLCP